MEDFKRRTESFKRQKTRTLSKQSLISAMHKEPSEFNIEDEIGKEKLKEQLMEYVQEQTAKTYSKRKNRDLKWLKTKLGKDVPPN